MRPPNQCLKTEEEVIEMTGRRTIALLLFCILAACAAKAPSASATQTLWSCEPGSGKEGYVDAHCVNETKVEAQVKYVHKSIAAGTETKVTFNNQETTNSTLQASPTMLSTSVAGVAVDIACFEASGSGGLTNVAGGSITGKASFEYSECVTPKPRTEGKTLCKVKEPIKITSASAKNYETGELMGLEFSPGEGKVFTEITLMEAEKACPLKGTYKLEGVMRSQYAGATGGSSTMLFETGGGELTFNGNQANFYSSVTVKMEGASTGVALTTGP
jgi:hypothetical protein